MITIKVNKQKIDYEKLTWSGTENQSSRSVVFTVPSNPYDKNFSGIQIKLGDLVTVFNDSKKIFVGTVTTREKTSEIGVITYTALDFMHHLLKSKGTYKFKDTTPEIITKKVCNDVQIKTSSLSKSKTKIDKLFFSDQPLYDIIIKAYRYAKAVTKKKYMPVMDLNKVSVIEKGISSGVTLTTGVNIISGSYSDTTDNLINDVKIYDDKLKRVGEIKNKKNIESYGVYQAVYKKTDKDNNAKAKAEALFSGITKDISIEAIGNIKAVSGKSIIIADKGTGVKGTYYISSDQHTFENGNHIMSLEITKQNTMESGADVVSESKEKPKVKDTAKCYYIDGATTYHSTTSCTACSGKKTIKSVVSKMKKVKITKGKNKGKRKYKPCSKCWET